MDGFHTLSIIEEATEVSEYDWRSSRPSQADQAFLQDPSAYVPRQGSNLSAHRISIFSSETSYGEVVPPGQSTLGLGISGIQPYFDKGLPSVPESTAGKSVSARSGASPAPSAAKSKSSQHSIAKSDISVPPDVDVPEIMSERLTAKEVSPRSPEKPISPVTIPSDQKSQSSQSTVRVEQVPRSSRSVVSPRSARNSLPPPREPSLHPSARSKSNKSYAPSESSSTTSRTQSPVELAPTLPSPSPRRSRSKSSSSAGGSIITISTMTRTEIKPRSKPTDVESIAESEMSATTHSDGKSQGVSTYRGSSYSSGQYSNQSTLRTFDDVVDEVASSLALRTKLHAETIDLGDSGQVKVGVCATMSRGEDQHFVQVLASKIHHLMALNSSYIFAIFPNMVGIGGTATLAFVGAPQRLVTKASILSGLRFKTRLAELHDLEGTWIGCLDPRPGTESWEPLIDDEQVLWDIVRKAASSISPSEPPAGSKGIDRRLVEARAKLDRLTPREAYKEAIQEGILVDIRPESQRTKYGSIPGAMKIERNELEWRFDPRSEERLPIADRYDLRVIIYCQEGNFSSLAAASLQDIGLWRATDIEGGYSRWEREGLPTNLIRDVHDDDSVRS